MSTIPELVSLYSPDFVIAAGVEQRIPIAVVEDEASATLDDQAELPVRVTIGGDVITELTAVPYVVTHEHFGEKEQKAHQHSTLYRYYPLRITLPKPGVYDVIVSFPTGTASLQVQAFNQQDIRIPLQGSKFPSVQTPTIDNQLDMDTLCTRSPQCPFHNHNVADLLQRNKPFALLIATPAFCATAYCGPVVETLIEASKNYPEIAMIHSEVYANTKEVSGNYQDERLIKASLVDELNLNFEPALFLVNNKGFVADRLDNLFDAQELDEVLAAL